MRAIGFPAKHLFWTVPANRPLRVINPGLGTRFVGLSQTESGNRLLGVRTIVLLSRAALLIPDNGVPLQAIPPGFQNLFQMGRGQSQITKDQILKLFPAPPSQWSAEEKAAIEAAAASPTPEESADVGLIDTLFGFMKLPRPQAVRGGYSTLGQPLGYLHILVCEGSTFPGGRGAAQPFPPLSTSPFYCTGAGPALPPRFKPSEFFGLDAEATWGDQRQTALNAKTLLDALADYPLPSPLSAAKPLWLDVAKDKLAEVARSKYPLSPTMARFMLTLIVLDTYEPASDLIMDFFKDRERKRKRNALIRAIVLTVVSLVLPAIAAAGFAAFTTVIDVRKKREAARDMAKAAQLFADTDAAFSDEVKRAVEILDYQVAQEGAAPLTPEETDALAEPGQEGTVTPEEMDVVAPGGEIPSTFPTTELLIGGGVAAVAAALFAFLR